MTRLVFGLFMLLVVVLSIAAVAVALVLLWGVTGGLQDTSLSLLLYPVAALVMVIWAFQAGGEFMRQLYDLDSRGVGAGFLFNSVSGLSSEFARVVHGQVAEDSKDSLLITVGGPGFLYVANDSAVALERAGRFTRVVAAQWTSLAPFETIRQAVDLRPQRRSGTSQGLTRDGIPVKAEYELEFRVGPEPEAAPEGEAAPAPVPARSQGWRRFFFLGGRPAKPRDLPELPFRFTCDTVWNAVYTARVRRDGVPTWDTVITWMTGSRLQDLLLRRSFDELFEPDGAGRAAEREKLYEELVKEVRQICSIRGVHLIRVNLGTIEIDLESPLKETIINQRIQAWQAEWVSRDTEAVAKSRAEALLIRERMRAEVQKDVIVAIADGLRSVPATPEMGAQLVAWRFVQALEQIVRTPATVEYLPTEQLVSEPMVLQQLEALETALGEGVPQALGTGQGQPQAQSSPSAPAAPPASTPPAPTPPAGDAEGAPGAPDDQAQ